MVTYYTIHFAFVGLLVYVLYTGNVNTSPTPTWPSSYKTCVEMFSNEEPIRAGWYVDGVNKRVRLDSYGIPEGREKVNRLETLISASKRKRRSSDSPLQHVFANDISSGWQTMDSWSDYACHLHGAPLYIFIFRYDLGVQYDIFPSPNPPGIDCTKQNLTDIFPEAPLLSNLYFVGVEMRNGTTVDHWRASYFLYDIDYLFNNQTGIPVSLFVNGDENAFSYYQEGKLEGDVFKPPDHLQCS
ncbi:uncharacterized protein LOC135462160 [Liolophura sinensis]|uniref:uncharacterized protein LOC135462160 n=1 Tax=Liolophura sinensis TaxID=3198878 RepID=UPI0031582BCB